MKITLRETTVAHVNVRREKAGDTEGPIAIDLKFTGDARPEVLKTLFATDEGYNHVLGNFFGDSGEMVSHDVGSITLRREAIGHRMTITAGLSQTTIGIEDCKVDKIKLTPEDGPLVGYSLRVQVKPTTELIAQLSGLLERQVTVEIEHKQTELDLEQPKRSRKKSKEEAQTELGMNVH